MCFIKSRIDSFLLYREAIFTYIVHVFSIIILFQKNVFKCYDFFFSYQNTLIRIDVHVFLNMVVPKPKATCMYLDLKSVYIVLL